MTLPSLDAPIEVGAVTMATNYIKAVADTTTAGRSRHTCRCVFNDFIGLLSFSIGQRSDDTTEDNLTCDNRVTSSCDIAFPVQQKVRWALAKHPHTLPTQAAITHPVTLTLPTQAAISRVTKRKAKLKRLMRAVRARGSHGGGVCKRVKRKQPGTVH